MKSFDELREKHLTPAEMKKREEVELARRRMQTEEIKYIDELKAAKKLVKEEADVAKLKLLARAGLVDQKDVERLMAAFKIMQAGKPLTQQQKDLIISSYSELASIVTGDSQTFQKAKKSVAKAVKLGD